MPLDSSSWTDTDPGLGQNTPPSQQAPIAFFRSGNYTESGDRFIFGVLIGGLRNVTAIVWDYGDNDMQTLPIDGVADLQGLQNHTALAANDDGYAYAIHSGVILEFKLSADASTWSLLGNATRRF